MSEWLIDAGAAPIVSPRAYRGSRSGVTRLASPTIMPRRTGTSASRPVKRPYEFGGEILAPEDWPTGDRLHAPDGRKLKDADFVGECAPDTDPA
jgi:hypothetical protein